MNLFSFLDYIDFIRIQVSNNTHIKGYNSRLAQAAGCKPSYLSQVINSHVELTPDHALGLANFWGLSKLERDYFLDLVNLSRASSPALKSLLLENLNSMKQASEHLGTKFIKTQKLDVEKQAKYYSSWHYAAIHIGLMIPQYNDPSILASALGIRKELMVKYLDDLKQMGLITKSGISWKVKETDIHIPRESPLASTNHRNWRDLAVEDSKTSGKGESVHYSACYSLSEAAISQIKKLALEMIEQSRIIAVKSKEVSLCAFNLDFFKII